MSNMSAGVTVVSTLPVICHCQVVPGLGCQTGRGRVADGDPVREGEGAGAADGAGLGGAAVRDMAGCVGADAVETARVPGTVCDRAEGMDVAGGSGRASRAGPPVAGEAGCSADGSGAEQAVISSAAADSTASCLHGERPAPSQPRLASSLRTAFLPDRSAADAVGTGGPGPTAGP